MSALQEYKCPSCDGDVEFDPSAQMIKCPWCSTEFDVAVFGVEDESTAPDKMEWEFCEKNWKDNDGDGVCEWVCSSCGGEILADENTAATRCPWCNSPVVMTGRVSGDLKPDYVIPFKFDKKAAKEALIKHVTSKKLAPKAFRNEHRVEEIKGVYVPCWLYDTDADANIRYRATTVRHWSDSRYNYTETCYYIVGRGGSISFEHIPHDASSKLPNDIMESIEPFDFSEALDFDTAYLAGYLADKYDVACEECIDRVNSRVKRSTEDIFRSTVRGYTTVTCENSSVQLHNAVARYALYPVWLLNTTWNGNRYTFAMNGQTGKFVGDLPLDKGAWWRWFLGISSAVSAAALAISLLIYFM